jgi:hypothetical protein
MANTKRSLGIAVVTCAMVAIVGVGSRAVAQMHTVEPSAANSNETKQAKIDRALSAGPADIAKGATVAEMDAQGKMIILRAGTNGFTCMPGDPTGVGQPAMCED